jgi:hypothetical protein
MTLITVARRREEDREEQWTREIRARQCGGFEFGTFSREHACREKTALTLASMVVVMAKPLGRPENVLQMVVNERWHAPVQSAALSFASTKQRRWTELSFKMTKQFAAVSAVALCN